MSFIIMEELMLFLHALLAGVGLLILYDILRILRRIIPHGGLLVAAEDILYWIFNALFIFYMMYRENSGAVRGYVIAGIVIGMLGYNLTLSPYLVDGISKLLNMVIRGIRKIIKTVLRPFCFLWRHTFGRFFGFLRKKYEILKNRLKNTVKQFTINIHKQWKKSGREDGKEKNKKEEQ